MRWALATAALLLASCSGETRLQIVVESDLPDAGLMDRLEVGLTSEGDEIWFYLEELSGERPLPRTFTVLRPRGRGPAATLAAEAGHGGETMLRAERQARFVEGRTTIERLCLRAACLGSDAPACAEGRCDGEVPSPDAGSDADGGDAAPDASGCWPGCPEGYVCDVATRSCCAPFCEGRECGSDGCGGECPPGCDEGQVCSGSTCCTPECDGRHCGSDGCGGECPPGCEEGEHCGAGETGCIPSLSWTEASTGSSPAPRFDHVMVYDASRQAVVLFGGTTPPDLSELWQHRDGDWAQIESSTTPTQARMRSAVYDAARGRLVVFGGKRADDQPSDETWEHDGSDWTLATPVESPPGRWAHALAYDEDRGVVVLFGGAVPEAGSRELYLDDTWEYDGSTWSEVACAPRPTRRRGHVMEWDSARGVIVLHGGSSRPPGEDVNYADTWEYDGTGWREVATAHSPPAAWERAAAYDDARGVVVLFGGADRARALPELDDLWEYDGADWLEVPAATRPRGRWRHEMAYDPDAGRLILFGGYVREPVYEVFDDTWIAVP